MKNLSPFHPGEKIIQERLGLSEKMERFGRQVIRDHLPDQHRDFYQHLPYVFVGHADKEGWPWASILVGDPGFMSSSNRRTLKINTQALEGDPLQKSLHEGKQLGLLGIELHSRRRNRLAGTIVNSNEDGIELQVDQTFGNCPQYIQARQWEKTEKHQVSEPVTSFSRLDEYAKNIITNSDTFFVASYVQSTPEQDKDDKSQGVDVSHRGGMPGFVKVDEDGLLTIPDYLGNFHFNTLGNFVENPKAGLLFFDFDRGHLLMLTGRVEILWDSPEAEFFDGAERLWIFRLDHGQLLKNALPIKWQLESFSPNSRLTGTWVAAEENRQANLKRQAWLPYTVTKIVDESESIRSFYLKVSQGAKASFKAGQFLTIRAVIEGAVNSQELIRTYTVSSAPDDEAYRISVKRDGVFSMHLHNTIAVGNTIDAKAPAGAFVYPVSKSNPVVLIAAGVGITPMMSILRDVIITAIKTRSIRPLVLIASARSNKERAFFDELLDLGFSAGNDIKIIWCLSQPEEDLQVGIHFDVEGRIDRKVLKTHLPKETSDVFVCGPDGFMQSTYNHLRSLNVDDSNIYAEAFGPASLVRDTHLLTEQKQIAEEALLTVVNEKGEPILEHVWQESDGTLLEFAESHGLSPSYACRSGQCGSCRAELKSGDVAYPQQPSATISNKDVLLCCAMPALLTKEATNGSTTETMAKITIEISGS